MSETMQYFARTKYDCIKKIKQKHRTFTCVHK